MIGILNRWRQFGRRYFWPHLLLGMVTAGFGLPYTLACERATLPETAFRSLTVIRVSPYDSLVLLQQSAKRASFVMDYWHQHAICTVIRHLSFTQNLVHYPEVSSAGVDELHQQVLLDTLTFLLGRTVRPSVQIPERRYQHFAITSHQVGLWLAARQGIRAGPLNTSLSVS